MIQKWCAVSRVVGIVVPKGKNPLPPSPPSPIQWGRGVPQPLPAGPVLALMSSGRGHVVVACTGFAPNCTATFPSLESGYPADRLDGEVQIDKLMFRACCRREHAGVYDRLVL